MVVKGTAGQRLQRRGAGRRLHGVGPLAGVDADQAAVGGVVERRRGLRAGVRVAGGEGQAGAVRDGDAGREVDDDVAPGGDDARAGAVGRDGEGDRGVRRDGGRDGRRELRRRLAGVAVDRGDVAGRGEAEQLARRRAVEADDALAGGEARDLVDAGQPGTGVAVQLDDVTGGGDGGEALGGVGGGGRDDRRGEGGGREEGAGGERHVPPTGPPAAEVMSGCQRADARSRARRPWPRRGRRRRGRAAARGRRPPRWPSRR